MKKLLKKCGVSVLTFLSLLSLLITPVSAITPRADDRYIYENVNAKKDDASSRLMLYPGGMPFGIRIKTGGACISSLSEFQSGGRAVCPARDIGMCAGDIIIKVDNEKVEDVRSVTDKVGTSGNEISITFLRDGKERNLKITPQRDDKDGKYKLGIRIRDTGAGIGTVTYIMPDGSVFGGLGHGICDSESGQLVPMVGGSVSEVEINGIVKGEVGKPGELRGKILSGATGTLISNTDCGTFGIFERAPSLCEPLPIAQKQEVKNGAAEVLCALDGDAVRRYKVEIYDVRYNDAKTKNFMVRVTDSALLEKTGGIVQGMSGSPLVQDGKIIGAVTHVLVNDPTCGYGIFIQNMLENTPKAVQ